MDENISKGLFGLNKKEVESYIAEIKKDYEQELRKQNQELLSMFGEMTFNSSETEEAVKEFVKIFGEV